REFLGIIGIHEAAAYFMKTNAGLKKLVYTFHVDNLARVMPGRFLTKGPLTDFRAPLMVGSMDYEHTIERMDSLVEDKPVLVVGNRKRILQHAVGNQFPLIVVTNVGPDAVLDTDLSGYSGTIFLSEADTADTIRLLWLSAPVRHILNPKPLVLQHDEVFDEAKKTLLGSDLRGLAVLKEGKFAGVVTRRSFIEKPRKKLILIDHNEADQSIPGAHEADIREIIDHHRLAAEKTNAPIYMFAKPLGSSCTIVFQHYRMHGLVPDRAHAILMMSGILSDTLFLKSPTATDEDRSALYALGDIANVDPAVYYKEMLGTMATLETLDPRAATQGDFKIYRDFGASVGIAQVEVVSLEGITDLAPRFQEALGQTRAFQGLDWAMLLVTEVMAEQSVLVLTPHPKAEAYLAYEQRGEGLYHLPGVVSRKKQLLPEVLRVLELAQA
ncbi:MAG TPA: DHHA2 domain-containing protein, partial [Spirochaetia bacterium]|nr:DHHA2 domain-containing protein [Spirochaetia bacterium]